MQHILTIFALLNVFLLSNVTEARSFRPEILSALKHLEDFQATTKGVYYPGQWPTHVSAILLPSLVGVGRWGRPYPEATIFTTAAIVDLLHQIHGTDPELMSIPLMIQRALEGFSPYSQGPFYNFYPPRRRNGVWVRGPRNIYLARYLLGFANIPPDADTTSSAYLALRSPAPDNVISALSRFRDLNRKPHYYNRRLGLRNTGAFLTWFHDESAPNPPGNFSRPERGPRIPFGTNDVDCVINANVLKLLTWQKQTTGPGYQAACQLLKKSIEQKKYGRCGVYYPTDYLLPLRVGELKELGATCLTTHHNQVLRFLLETQNPRGFWVNSPPNRPDEILSTAVALNALLLLGDRQNARHREQVRRGVEYLLRNSRRDQAGHLYWKGQVFFSAVAQARYSVVWRSSSYTTVQAARALQLAEDF